MVVICAGVVTKLGRILLGRAFTSVSRVRLEGLLHSFPKLVPTAGDAAHTFIETDSVRYVYQPMESLYVLLVTTKNSNLLEDLETLRTLAKLLPEYCGGQSEEHVAARVFELSFAVDELLTPGGYREHVTLQQIRTFTEMDSHEEKLQRIILESKMNQARDEARRKAMDIDQQKAALRQAQAMGGGGGGMGGAGGAGGRYSAYGSDSGMGGGGGGGYGSPYGESAPMSEPSPASKPSRSKPSDSFSTSSSAAPKGKVKGMQLSKAKKTDDFFEQLNKEEKLAPPSAAARAGPLGSAAPAAVSPSSAAKQGVRVLLEEKLVCEMDREGGVRKLEIKGELKLSIYDPDHSKIVLLTSGPLQEKDGFKCRLHPKINKQLWSGSGSLGLVDPTKSFPVGSDNAPIILKWRKESSSESDVPITLNFWPNDQDGQTVVSVEYAADVAVEKGLELRNVLVQIPCPAQEPPEITSSEDGEVRFDQKHRILNWRIPLITADNSSGSLEFSVPELDSDHFFPIQLSFDSATTISQIGVNKVVQAEQQEQEVEFVTDTQMSVEKYVIE